MIHNITLSDGTRIARGQGDRTKRVLKGELRLEEYRLQREQHFYERKVKYMEMADMRISGKTLQEIATHFDFCSRERIRQILHQYFSDIDFSKVKHKSHKKFAAIEIKCLQCGILKIFPGGKSFKDRKFCSFDCFIKSVGGKRLPIPVKKMSKEQFREFNRIRCGKYYHKYKNTLYMKEKRREYNRRAAIKLKEKKNAIR